MISADVKMDLKFDQVGRDTEKVVDISSKEVAKKIEADAKRFVPVLTGALRNSIKAHKSKFEGENYVVYAGDENKVPYARVIEFGKKNQAPNPYMRKALAKNKSSYKTIVKKNIKVKFR